MGYKCEMLQTQHSTGCGVRAKSCTILVKNIGAERRKRLFNGRCTVWNTRRMLGFELAHCSMDACFFFNRVNAASIPSIKTGDVLLAVKPDRKRESLPEHTCKKQNTRTHLRTT